MLYKFSLFILLLSCYQNAYATRADSTPIITVGVDVVAANTSVDLQYLNRKTQSYFIVITVTNTQDTTLHFTTMTCSWEYNFVFNNDSFYLYFPGCDSNVFTSLDILPHKSAKFFSLLGCYKKNADGNYPSSFRIGFVDLTASSFWNNISRKEKAKYKTYWSAPMLLRSKLYEFENETLPDK